MRKRRSAVLGSARKTSTALLLPASESRPYHSAVAHAAPPTLGSAFVYRYRPYCEDRAYARPAKAARPHRSLCSIGRMHRPSGGRKFRYGHYHTLQRTGRHRGGYAAGTGSLRRPPEDRASQEHCQFRSHRPLRAFRLRLSRPSLTPTLSPRMGRGRDTGPRSGRVRGGYLCRRTSRARLILVAR
jgi:hypothetical protein